MLVTPYLIKIVFDRLEQQAPSSEILKYVLAMFGLAVLSGVFRFMMRRTIVWMSRRIEYDLRGDIFAHLLKLSPSFYHRNRTGDVMARMTNDLEAVRSMIGPGILQASNTVTTILFAVPFMIALSPELTAYALLPAAISPFLVYKVGSIIHPRFVRIQNHFSEMTAGVQENLAGVRVIKAYRQEQPERDNFAAVSKRYFDLNMDLARLYGVFYPMMMFVGSAVSLIVFYFGGLEVMGGRIPLGTLVAFFAYMSMLFWPLFAVGWVVSLYQRGTASLDRINEVLFTEPEIKSSPELHRNRIKGRIEFRNLQFVYNGSNVLEGINLVIEPGQTVGVVGKTGSGKTTLVSLLARLYSVAPGQIFIDGVDINDWDVADLRRQIGFAVQEAFLFSESIGENIRFGRPDASMEMIAGAADAAALSGDVDDFPERFETLVGERGITISGGQRQRTAIARAILGDPAILILDDVTSAVDTETEARINHNIREVLAGRTSIIISHRISAVKEADLILYLQEGRIVEQGDHNSLISCNGLYASLYRAQLIAEELERL